MPDGEWSLGELGRRIEVIDRELENLRFVRIEEYEPRHKILMDRLDKIEKRLDRLDMRVYVVLGGLAAGLLGYAGVTARGFL